MRPLKTDHGKHSDTKLAYAMAADLVENSANLSGQDALDMRKMENTIGEKLEKHFAKLADREHAGIEANGHDHLFESLEAHPEHAEEIKAEVMSVYTASPFAAKMDMEVAANNVHDVVGQWVRIAQHMHRDWFARHGKVGNHLDLVDAKGHDPKHANVQMWKDIHDGPSPQLYAEALHRHATKAA